MKIHGEAEDGSPFLIGSGCQLCGRVGFPIARICPACGSENVGPLRMGRKGRVVGSAVVYNAPKGFEVPYVVGVVELEEGPIVFCPIAGARTEAPRPGTPVVLLVGPARPGGTPVFQYQPEGSQNSGARKD